MWKEWKLRRRARRMLRQLEALDDRLLMDIGLSPEHLAEQVLNLVEQTEPERKAGRTVDLRQACA